MRAAERVSRDWDLLRAALRGPDPGRRLTGAVLTRARLSPLFRINRPGYRLVFHPAALAKQMWRDPEFRVAEERFLAGFAAPGDTVIDIGANIGSIALALASAVGPEGRVIAVEAHPRTCRQLRRNVVLNGFVQVEVRNVAISSARGEVRFSDERADDMNHITPDGAIVVPTIPLADLITGPVSVLKVDVEGQEYDVLDSGGAALRQVSVIQFEYVRPAYARSGRSLAEVLRLLDGHGFDVAREVDGRLVPLPAGFDSDAIENLIAVNRHPPTRPEAASRH